MSKTSNRVQKSIMIGLFGSISICFIIVFGYIFLRELDRANCYTRLAEKLGVSPTYEAISNNILSELDSDLVPGMDHSAVITILEQIAPVSSTRAGPTLSAGVFELTSLKTCFFYANNVLLLIEYDRNNKFVDAVPFIND